MMFLIHASQTAWNRYLYDRRRRFRGRAFREVYVNSYREVYVNSYRMAQLLVEHCLRVRRC